MNQNTCIKKININHSYLPILCVSHTESIYIRFKTYIYFT